MVDAAMIDNERSRRLLSGLVVHVAIGKIIRELYMVCLQAKSLTHVSKFIWPDNTLCCFQLILVLGRMTGNA
jgi:hypothetical protein